MKKIFYISLMTGLILSFGFTVTQTMDNCDKKSLSESCKKKLEDFKYDSQKFTKINFVEKAQQMEVEVPVFIGEKYRLVFNTTSLPKPITISVYTKDKENTKRTPIYTNKDVPAGTNELVFDAPRVRNMFVDYNITGDNAKGSASGCVVFMVAYR